MKNLAIIAFTAASLVACGSGRKNAAENAKQAAEAPELQNKSFKSTCTLGSTNIVDGLINSAKSLLTGGGLVSTPKSYRTEYEFTGAKVKRKTVSYVKANCEGDEMLVQTENGDIKIDKDNKTNDGAKSLKMVFDKLEVTARGESGVAFANGTKVCGKSDWSANTAVDMTSKAQDENCYGGSKMPRTAYTVFKVDGDKLSLNPDTLTEMTSENQRPNSLKGATDYTILK